MYLKTLFAYTDHQERKADRQVKEIAHIKVPICWEVERQLKKLVHIRGQSSLAVQLLSKLYDEVWLIPQSLLY